MILGLPKLIHKLNAHLCSNCGLLQLYACKTKPQAHWLNGMILPLNTLCVGSLKHTQTYYVYVCINIKTVGATGLFVDNAVTRNIVGHVHDHKTEI